MSDVLSQKLWTFLFSIEDEIKQGHIFLLDYGLLEEAGVVGEYTHEGDTRHQTAPFCLLYADASRQRPLVPVAIQVTRLQKDNIIWTPADSESDWRIAKLYNNL